MESEWILVFVLWGILICTMLACLISEAKKTPEQKKADAEKSHERWLKAQEAEKKRRQDTQNNVPAIKCLQRTIQFGLSSLFFMVLLIICIMVLIASGLD